MPLIELSVTGPTRLLAGEVVRLTFNSKVKGEIRRVDASTAEVAVVAQAKALKDSGLAPGDEAVFVGLDPWGGMDPWAPDEVPWTHRDTTSDLAGDVGDVGELAAAAAADDSPDLSLAELDEIPVIGIVGPADEPGVVL